MSTTIVTAFFDIGRDKKGDGRTIDEYLGWIKKTLQLNCNLFIVTEQKFKHFFIDNRPENYRKNTVIKIIDFKDSHYYRYYDRIKQILESPEYISKIKDPNRVECKLPEYNIIQYSKFHYLQMAINENSFQSEYFLWADAGISRFFLDVDLSKSYPSSNGERILQENKGKFIIQNRNDIYSYPLDDSFVWKSDNLLVGTMFGGSISVVQKMAELIEQVFNEKMLNKNNANNEQLALALVWKDNPDTFCLIRNYLNFHLCLFKHLS
jgi:hypothetical protein